MCSTSVRDSGGDTMIPMPRDTAASTLLARSITPSGVVAASSSRRIHSRSSVRGVACAAICST